MTDYTQKAFEDIATAYPAEVHKQDPKRFCEFVRSKGNNLTDEEIKKMLEKNLYLTLKKCWFDLILQGIKTEEYREVKPYWIKRLAANWKMNEDGSQSPVAPFDNIIFRNGYGKNSPTMKVKCKGGYVGRGMPAYGAPENEDVFILELGEIIETKNC